MSENEILLEKLSIFVEKTVSRCAAAFFKWNPICVCCDCILMHIQKMDYTRYILCHASYIWRWNQILCHCIRKKPFVPSEKSFVIDTDDNWMQTQCINKTGKLNNWTIDMHCTCSEKSGKPTNSTKWVAGWKVTSAWHTLSKHYT